MTIDRIFYKGLTPELVKKAEEELNEFPEVKANALKELKELIYKNQDIHGNFEDEYLVIFLRGKKFDAQKAYNVLCNHVNLIHKYNGTFTCRAPSEVWDAMKTKVIYVLPQRLPDMSHVTLLRLGAFDPSVITAENFIACLLTWSLVILDYEVTQIAGFHFLIDFSDTTFRNYKPFATLTFVKFMISVMQDCTPLRIRGVHLVNEPVIFHNLLSIAKYLISSKLRDRVHLHGNDLGSLHGIIPKNLLPEWLGGNASLIEKDELIEFYCRHDPLIDKLKQNLMIKTETHRENRK